MALPNQSPIYKYHHLPQSLYSALSKQYHSFFHCFSFHFPVIVEENMGGFSFELETGVAPAKMFKASVLDAHKLLPKIMPEQVSSVSVQGDGGVGSFKEYKFTGALPFTHVKERVDVLDKDNLVYKFTLVEGGQLGEKLASAVYHVKFVPSSSGGCVVKVSAEITPISGAGYPEEEASKGKDGMMGMYKGVESFLLANPNAYA